MELYLKSKSMDITAEKISIIQQITKINDEKLILAIKNLLDFGLEHLEAQTEPDFWTELNDEQKEAINISIQQLANGEGIPHEEVMASFREKYSK